MKKKREMTWLERLYYPELVKGLLVTARHFFVNLFFMNETQTFQWPEEERPISPRWRGRHRLNKREDGTTRCTACMLCATVCPSECIHIVAGEYPDRNYEKYPLIYEVDLFRCCYCGMCVEACPCNAILMDTQDMRFSTYTQDKFLLTKEKLMDW